MALFYPQTKIQSHIVATLKSSKRIFHYRPSIWVAPILGKPYILPLRLPFFMTTPAIQWHEGSSTSRVSSRRNSQRWFARKRKVTWKKIRGIPQWILWNMTNVGKCVLLLMGISWGIRSTNTCIQWWFNFVFQCGPPLELLENQKV